MLWIILIIIVGLVVFTGGDIFGWIYKGIQAIYSLLGQGFAALLGCGFKIFMYIILALVLYALLFS